MPGQATDWKLEMERFKKKSNSLRPNASLKIDATAGGVIMNDNISTPGFRKSRALSSENLLEQADYLDELNMNIKKQNKDFNNRHLAVENKQD